jgi:hypothetical protein
VPGDAVQEAASPAGVTHLPPAVSEQAGQQPGTLLTQVCFDVTPPWRCTGLRLCEAL